MVNFSSSSSIFKKLITTTANPPFSNVRTKTTSSQYVASRSRDPTFEKLMDNYQNLLKVFSIHDLLLASPRNTCSLHFLDNLAQKLHLNRGAASFLRKFPQIFQLFPDQNALVYCRITETALAIAREEAAVIEDAMPVVVERLVRLLSLSVSKTLPLRAVFRMWRELGLPDDFEDSVISRNGEIFELCDDPNEPNAHLLKLVKRENGHGLLSVDHVFSAAADDWRVNVCCDEEDFDSSLSSGVDRTEIRYAFRHKFPPGMKLGKNFKAKVKEWQKLPYIGPYEEMVSGKNKDKKALEKRAVGIVHEIMSLTVEKMVEVEKISHFRKWCGIELNIRDLFLDHPGIFYMSTKGKRHTVFLREAYERGCLIHPNPVYDARRKLLDLVILGRCGGLVAVDSGSNDIVGKHNHESNFQEEEDSD